MRRTILALMKKEFYQVIRDRNMLRMIFIMPVIQLLVLGYAINVDVKNIYTAVYDYDRSELSREYQRSLSAGDYFILESSELPLLSSGRGLQSNRFNTLLVIPNGFAEELNQFRPVTVGFIVDGANANSASIATGYMNVITSQFNKRVTGFVPPLSIRQKRLYNPEGESVYFMVPGIVTILLTMITVMLTSMAIVREREIGTLEQLLVTPITTPALILGKIIPFAIIGFLEMSLALLIGILWFNIPFAGSWALLYGLSVMFLFTTLGIGMFISTVSKTQQQAMFYAWFFSIFALLTSGFFTPIENMPQSIQYVTYLNPLRYFMKVVRGIMMKGATIEHLQTEIVAMGIFGLAIFSFSWMRFSKRTK